MRTDDDEFARPARPPDTTSWSAVREAAKDCEACHLYKRATQTVFGEGPKGAVMMLVGEQPGDYEDVAGKPFVGPAGKIMDQALEEAGIDRSKVYHERSETFQMGAARETADSSETKFARDCSLPPMAGNGVANR